MSPIRAKALAVFAAALHAVFNGTFVLPSGAVSKPQASNKDPFGKKDKEEKPPICQRDIISRPISRVMRPPSPRPLGKRHGSKATA